MSSEDQAFFEHLLGMFRVEAEEHLEVLANGVLELERDPDVAAGAIEQLFREAHSLKGAARAVELTDVESVCQAIESVLAGWKDGSLPSDQAQFDALNDAIDYVREAAAGRTDGQHGVWSELTGRLQAVATAGSKPQPTPTPGDDPPAPTPTATSASDPDASSVRPRGRTPQIGVGDTIRVSLERLTDLMLRMEELIGVKVAMRRHVAELDELLQAFAVWTKKGQTLRAAMPRSGSESVQLLGDGDGAYGRRRKATTDALLDYVGWSEDFVREFEQRVARLSRTLELDERTAAPLIDELLESMKAVVMMPFSSLSQALPKMVRDLARAEGKAVDLQVTGGDIEIDRHVLETIKDPIIHILRNCVGHGIETPDVRTRSGKAVRGIVAMAIERGDGNDIRITIRDDGAGIDLGRLRDSALEAGALRAEDLERIADDDLLTLVFESGVTTNAIVTDVAGRGIGLAIVLEKIEQLGGRVAVHSLPGRGTTFELMVPATVASSRGLLVRVADRLFVLPTTHVERVARVRLAEIGTIESTETITLDGENVSFAFLHDALGLPRQVREEDAAQLPVVVLTTSHDRMAFAVDWILGEQEVLVKPLGPLLRSVPFVTGATILDGERIALILNPPETIRAAVHGYMPREHTLADAVEASAPTRRSILIAEDSITSRTLLKNIFEAAGYTVRTTVDGIEALSALREEEFDLVISDVEMPRLDGFGLCAQIREEAGFSELPVMLVTSLESPEDRERGIGVGANAYITKGGFDQTTVLETARQLIQTWRVK
jgi:two-component system chemotaxis sensor kinase CheA